MADNLYIDVTLPEAAAPGGNPNGPPGPGIPLKEDDAAKKNSDALINAFNAGIMSMIKFLKPGQKLSEEMQRTLDNIYGDAQNAMEFEKGDKGFNTPKGKRKDKIEDYFAKKMVAADFFTKMGGHLKNIAKSVGSFAIDVLKFLFLFALLGPDFLNSIIEFVLDAVMMIAEALINAIPVVINAVIKFLPRIIKLIGEIIPKILDALIKSFEQLGDNELLPAPLRMFFKLLEGVAIVLKFLFEAIVNNLDLILPLLILVGIAYAAYIAYTSIIAAMTWIKVVAQQAEAIALGEATIGSFGFAAALWSMLVPLLPIILAVAALVVVLILIWKYSDEIVGFFEGIYDWFTHLGKAGKILVIALALLFLPITILIGLVYGIAKLFQGLKSGAVQEFLGNLLHTFMNWIKMKFLPVFFKYLSKIPDYFKALINGILYYLNPLNLLKDVGSLIGNVISSVIDSVFGSGTFQKLFSWFSNLFSGIFDDLKKWLKGHGFGWLFGEGDSREELAKALSKVSAVGDESRKRDVSGILQDLTEGKTGAQLTQKIADIRKARVGQLSEGEQAYIDELKALSDQIGPTGQLTNEILTKMNDNIKAAAGGSDNISPTIIQAAIKRGL